MLEKDYKKYKWFFTSSEKLVIGGKSADQNDELLNKLKKTKKEYYVMHTSAPGSPFCVVLADIKEVGLRDLEEAAVFTGCFSRAWKGMKRKSDIHIFKLSQVSKGKNMKNGTWNIKGEVNKTSVELKLVLTKQNGIYRAVPLKTASKDERLLTVCPGEDDKAKMVDKIIKKLRDKNIKKDEIIAALPAGGVEIC